MDREVAMRLAETEYERFLDLLRSLRPEDWNKATDCPGWDVRAMAGHTTGMALMATGLKETLRQSMIAKRRGGVPLDALTALQVEEHADLTRLLGHRDNQHRGGVAALPATSPATTTDSSKAGRQLLDEA
jgi:uncharacterized protein (TIGR03083 family)